ncbi:penicillin-binding transpeptidase domain-containing protein [Lentzea sp. NPDC051213]|uniref:penicillin-binding transpeptidase domain-containing protein n=1 Tax=Lentzea sp. NPDC051213 TaxID=3364126 RepID=UPI0037AEEDD9
MKRFLPTFGALVLVAALVGAVVWLRPDPPPPAPTPLKEVVLQYADGSELWSSHDGHSGWTSYVVRRVLSELDQAGLPFDRLQRSGAVVRTTIDAKAQTTAAAVVGRLVSPKRRDLGASVTAIDPASGGVQVYLALSRLNNLAGDEPRDLGPEIARPLAEVGLGRAQMSPLDVTAAYATVAAGGVRRDPHFVATVTSADGALLFKAVDTGKPAFDQAVADRMTAVLKEKPGCNGAACVPGAFPWTVGYTPQLAVAVFVDEAGAAIDDADLPRVVWQEFLASLAG